MRFSLHESQTRLREEYQKSSSQMNGSFASWHCLFLASFFAAMFYSARSGNSVLTDCGGVFTAPQGVLSTPNFPDPYPWPISCEWLIHAPPNKQIIIYFTQFYMKDSVFVSRYDAYKSITTHVGQENLGEILWEYDLSIPLVTHKPYLLLRMDVDFIGNRHIRVIDHLLEVFGFNITYEIIDYTAPVKQTCSVKGCSYLGKCLAVQDFSDFYCECFDEKFFGDECQYGPHCDPNNNLNLCLNGGKCRYFFGSLVNQCECPQGFEGAYCEIETGKMVANFSRPRSEPKECARLNCTEMCSTDDNDIAHCVCLRDGYVVEDVNSQCEAERYRFDVRMPLEAGPAIIFSEMDATIDNVKQTLQNHFPESGVTYPFKLKVHGIRGMTEPVLKFTLYFWTSEVEVVRKAVERFRIQANISNIRFLDVPAVLDINPELQLMEVVNTEKYPTLRGKMLTLVCAAKGSKDTQFEWYKDGVRLNTSLTSRVAWETVISHTAHEKRISNLHLDVVMPIDQGIFTCKVRDFDEVASKSLEVTVNNYPQVQIDPMSMSVQSGRPITIKCMSLDDSWQQFLYEWYKNGLTIDPSSRSEYTEDMYPTGVQLVVSRITMTTEYTCKVTNEAGSANVSSYVFVVSADDNAHYCPEEKFGQVTWSNTSGENFDVKRCPTEYGGEYLLASYRLGVVDVGNARRDCTCDMSSHICKWATPNFSKCQSLMLIKIFDDLVLLRSGYQETTLSAIFNDLYSFALTKNKNATLYSGDIDMVAGILKELITHMNAFPILCENDDRIKSKSVVDVLGAILRLSAKATIEEKQDIMVGPSVICSIHYLISGAVTLLEYKPTERIVNPDIDLQLQTLPRVTETRNVHSKQDTSADRQIVYMVTARHLAELLVYRDMSATGIKRMKFESMSRVYSLAPLVNDNMDPETPTVRLTLFHDTKGRVTKYNTTRCFRWLFDPLNIYSGRWSQDGCVIIESRLNSTTCECKLPGHFVAGLIPSNYSEIQVAKPDREILPEFVVSYILSIIILLISFIAYFKTYGFLTRDLYLVNMGFFFAVLAIACLSFTCMLHLSASLVVMEIFSHTISFLTFVIWSAMLVEIIHICLIAYKSTNIQMTSCKFATFIFGIPAILTAFLILVAQLDKGRSCHVICWLYDGTRQFYVFVSIIVVYIIVYAVFYSLCLNKILRWKEESKFTERKMHLIAILKNAALLVSVCFAMGSAISLESNSHTAHRVIHTILIIFYSIMIFLVRCLLDKDVQLTFRSKCGRAKTELREDQMKNKAFRAYMKPEFVSHVVVSQEQYNVSKYYDEVNRTKYTVERKRELSALLGSSASSAAITADTNSTTVSYNSSSDGSKDSNAPSGLVDFTYPSRRDSRLDTISDSKSSLSDRSVGMSGNVKDEMFVARARSHITDDTISVQKDDKIGIHKASNSGDFKNSTAARVDILKKKSSVPVARSKAITRNSLQRQCSQSSVNHGKESQSMLPDSTTNHSVQRHELLPNTSRSESSNTTNTKEQISCNVAKFQKNNLKSPKQQTENTVGKSYDISTCQDEDQIEISCSSKLLQIS
ncbi:uncharacterized protein LOC128214543 isoform X2 [Mya arenaria]|uniref:uncharacterized protein LOC128214543 isoform X2 n=1 Tax=Mya arenaria TaxID=6604 RepID=UPI0022E7993B|nr:uncharacterized protein LOC128214543 isoform X2 [Mya arenaria]